MPLMEHHTIADTVGDYIMDVRHRGRVKLIKVSGEW